MSELQRQENPFWKMESFCHSGCQQNQKKMLFISSPETIFSSVRPLKIQEDWWRDVVIDAKSTTRLFCMKQIWTKCFATTCMLKQVLNKCLCYTELHIAILTYTKGPPVLPNHNSLITVSIYSKAMVRFRTPAYTSS